MQQCCNSMIKREEKGAVLILFLFIFAALLALAGLAVDAGNLYRARLQLQKAVDAAVLAGIGTTILDRQDVESQVEARANAILHENLDLAGILLKTLQNNPDIHYNTDTKRINVRATADIDFLLMDAVPFFILGLDQTPSGAQLSAVATGKRAEANIALVLDFSFSMDCPGIGNCTCQTPGRGTETCEQEAQGLKVNRKIVDLRNAVHTFTALFNEDRDRISLIPFSTAAQVSVPVKKSPDRGFKPDDFNVIDTIDPRGNTNVCDGFYRAYADMVDAKIIDNPKPEDDENVAYVYFSDGAPTAGRLLLANNPPGNLELSPGMGAYDYIHYTVEWVNQSEEGHFPGPSQLVKTPGIAFDYKVGDSIVGSIPGCSAPYTAIVPETELPDEATNSQFSTSVFTGCVQNLGFHMPFQAVPVYGSEYGVTKPFTSWREQYYNCAIQAADFVREHKGLVYVIGLGDPVAVGTDPYQDVNSTLSRKDVFLTRMAADKSHAGGHPEFDFGETGSGNAKVKKWLEIQKGYGLYLATPNSSELESLFKKIALKIRLRLLS
jgi:Flp pilus assembly protein TadG